MTSSQIINSNDFKAESDFKYSKVKINKSGGKSVGVLNSKNNKGLYISTPLMLTWGVNEYVDDNSGRRSYDLSLQFPKEEYANEETTKLLNSLIEMQERIKNDAIKYSKEWMNKAKLSYEVVDALFHPMLKYPKDPNTGEPDMTRAPTLKVKIPYWDNVFNCEIYNWNQEVLYPNEEIDSPLTELIPKASNTMAIIQAGGLWFANGKFGCTWKLFQCVVKPKESLRGKCHIYLSKEDKEKLETSSLSLQEDDDVEEQNEVQLTIAEDTDEEQDDNDVVHQEEQEEKPKKKIRRTKKKE